jgi:hypothetical protein
VVFWRRSKPQGVSLQELHAVVMKVKQLEEDILALEAKHERLRGRFYATRGPDSPPAPTSKGDILRAHGYLPGKPIPREG